MNKVAVLLVLVLLLTVGLLVSCQAEQPTSTLTATILPSVTSPAPALSPTPASGLHPAVAEAFPLQEGATWRYQAHIEEELGGQVQVRDEIITERVISQTQQANVTIFTLELVGGLDPGRFYYLVRGNSVYRVPPSPGDEVLQHFLANLQSSEPTYVFPLRVGASWGTIATPLPDHWYEWYVEGQEQVDVPAGHFADCYRLVYWTNPGDATLWSCPGVGLARLRYRHHGSVHNEDWVLVSHPGMTMRETPMPEPSLTPTARASEDPFPRAAAWFEAGGYEHPTDEQMTQYVEVFSADAIAYLESVINPALPLEEQQAALAQMAADLPSHSRESGQVVPVDLDEAAQAELFIVPKLNGGPLLYVRHVDGNWQSLPVPVVPPKASQPVDNAVNIWPATAEARDVTGDGQPEALVTHTFSGGSNWREHLQVLRWNGAGFDVLFRAELVNWAGRSTWELKPSPTGGQDIVLRYPYFYPTGFEAKMVAHPWATQRWRWDPSLELYTLRETTRDPESVLRDWENVPEWELLRVLVNEAELRYQAGDLEEALAGYRDIVARGATMERPEGRAVHWPAYARLRAVQVQALLGQAEAAQVELSNLLADLDEDSNLRPLVQVFDETYDPTRPDAALRAMASLHGLRLYEQFYWHDDRPGDLTFPMNMTTLLWPGTPLAQWLAVHPEAVDGPPSPEREQALSRALSDLSFPVTEVRIPDLNADGLNEVLVTTDETDQHNGPRSVWLLAQIAGRWRSCRQPNADPGLSEDLTEEPLPDGRIILRRSGAAFMWTGGVLVEVDPETYEPLPLPWSRVGGWD